MARGTRRVLVLVCVEMDAQGSIDDCQSRAGGITDGLFANTVSVGSVFLNSMLSSNGVQYKCLSNMLL